MKLLLDTHALIWSATDPDRIARDARREIEDGTNEVLVSVVSAWEIAIKQSLGKLDLAKPAEEWFPEVLRRTAFELVEPGMAAALRVRALPWHHKDPFDRFLIAQAIENGYTIITHDRVFARYGVPLLLA
ncbi:MAG TPA: type II toxin-antitoxin system VapC family toxin [Thermoanaerobaculia bacterium]|nr:type II toxin-antitoxin system VapC family toxin [Thermoanaerobaculia bacterium]